MEFCPLSFYRCAYAAAGFWWGGGASVHHSSSFGDQGGAPIRVFYNGIVNVQGVAVPSLVLPSSLWL